MSKPLTIEELKALPIGEWVWVENILGTKLVVDFRNGYYRKGLQDNKPDEHFTTSWYSYNLFFNYNLYGKTWLAYKNKEQAEGKDKDMIERIEKAYEHNLAECERCMKKVDIKHQFAIESMKEHIRKETAKEILQCWYNENKALGNEQDYVLELAEKYEVEVDE